MSRVTELVISLKGGLKGLRVESTPNHSCPDYKLKSKHKRSYIGSEMSSKYVDVANKRLKKFIDQPKLF